MEVEKWNILPVIVIKENGYKVNSMEQAHIYGKLAKNIMANI